MSHYHIIGQYRQDIHANVDAESPEDAVRSAAALFEKWMENMTDHIDGVWFSEGGSSLDDEVLVTEARTPTQEDRSYWSEAKEVSLYDITERTKT